MCCPHFCPHLRWNVVNRKVNGHRHLRGIRSVLSTLLPQSYFFFHYLSIECFKKSIESRDRVVKTALIAWNRRFLSPLPSKSRDKTVDNSRKVPNSRNL